MPAMARQGEELRRQENAGEQRGCGEGVRKPAESLGRWVWSGLEGGKADAGRGRALWWGEWHPELNITRR